MQNSVLCVVSGNFVGVNVWLDLFSSQEEAGNCGFWSTAYGGRLVTSRWNCCDWSPVARICFILLFLREGAWLLSSPQKSWWIWYMDYFLSENKVGPSSFLYVWWEGISDYPIRFGTANFTPGTSHLLFGFHIEGNICVTMQSPFFSAGLIPRFPVDHKYAAAWLVVKLCVSHFLTALPDNRQQWTDHWLTALNCTQLFLKKHPAGPLRKNKF